MAAPVGQVYTSGVRRERAGPLPGRWRGAARPRGLLGLAGQAIVRKLHAEAYFGVKALAGGHRVPGLVERVKRALEGLKEKADVSAQDPRIGDDPPASAREIRAFVSDIEARLGKL